MFLFKRIRIRTYEIGLHFRDGEFRGLLGGRYALAVRPARQGRASTSCRSATPWLVHEKLDVIVRVGRARGPRRGVDLKDYERGLVWIDGRFSHILPPGLYAYWTGQKDVRVEVVDARKVRFEHEDFKVDRAAAARGRAGARHLHGRSAHCVGVLFLDGGTSRRCRRASTPSGRDSPRPSWSRSTSARRWSTSRPGDHDGRQGHAAHERGGDVPRRRRPQGGHGDRRRAAVAVPRGAACAAGRGRCARARCVPDGQGRRRGGDRGRPSAAARASWVWRSSRWASATSSCRAT